jgi:DNA-binding NarL/FixJ family response regulator
VPAYRVLVVDDFEPWRRHVSSTLGQSSRWQIVADAADGAEAIQKAAALRPDVILLDVGLPTLNGIEAARRILAHDPNLKVLFVSEHQSWEIAEAALCTGARGYICKSDSGRELLPAMDSIVQGRRFVAGRLGGRIVGQRTHGRSPNSRRHEAAFYSNNELFLEDWTSIAADALTTGATFIVLAVDEHRNRLPAMLEARGVNVARAVRDGRFISFSVAEAISQWMVDGFPDETRFWPAVTSVMLAAARASTSEPPHVVACGECAPRLCARGDARAAIRLEQLWDEVATIYNLDVFCGYSSNGCRCDDPGDLRERLTAVHTAMYAR